MNNICVYCEIDGGIVSDVSLELISKAVKLAAELKCEVEAVAIGSDLKNIEDQISPYGAHIIHISDDKRLYPYTTLPHSAIFEHILKEQKPQIVLVGATSVGRDLAPRIASSLRCGLTADCTDLVIGEYFDPKTGKEYKNLLYQIRPAFGGNIIATIVNPETKPQMATVREGVMKKEGADKNFKSRINTVNPSKILDKVDFAVKIIERHIEARKVNLSGTQVIVSGGFGVGSKEGFSLLYELARVIGGEVGASRAAVDAGFAEHARQVGQTGVTVRPKLYIACGISGAIQHRAGMDGSAQIISINTDPEAPINSIADVAITGDLHSVIPKMIKYYKEQSK
ncbi:MAG: electron transfer flavoprotein subunit alpha/FixB family protein [Candidatus Delongbacteria bacterium]|nr:electron transfer flavoprotein subunit alpha/FixB family protein [Candidatus Delongbacteria bacterium]MCG2760896.1 electron transfer flavoprotein subunit alpha/FixB family protein [Candidatus Delongbacteria bacterium]